MKRFGNLWPQITAFENLWLAARQAQRSKRYRDNVLNFNYVLETQLKQLQTELMSQTYRPSPYRTFHIIDPKRRLISAAPYRDRVVHHALCNIIVPLLEPSLIADTYANREGLGSHKALTRYIGFCRSSRFVLQCDIRKYFPNIDHAQLKAMLRRKIKCWKTLWLIETIIDNSNPQNAPPEYFPGDDLLDPLSHPRGLPIGNLTSQIFANLYLSGMDHFIKETLRIKKYVRYMDDFALFSDDRAQLSQARYAIEDYLCELRLKIHPIKSQLSETQFGANFLGFRIFPDRIRVLQKNIRRGKQRLRALRHAFEAGTMTSKEVMQSIQSWQAHLNHGDTWKLQQQLFASLTCVRE